jgi:phosphatidylserine decarboxylase
MKHRGKALRAAWRLNFWTLIFLLALLASGVLAIFMSKLILSLVGALFYIGIGLAGLWIVFSLATFYFFRDPDPAAPAILNAIVAPASGKIDVIDQAVEHEFMGGVCQRISVFLSLIDVHVQKAPVRGQITYVHRNAGRFTSTMNAAKAATNTNVLIGLESSDYPGQKLAVRLVAGVLARKILTFVTPGDKMERSERISLIQYGSRCDLYLPSQVQIRVRVGEKVSGGETIVAAFD